MNRIKCDFVSSFLSSDYHDHGYWAMAMFFCHPKSYEFYKYQW